MRRLRGDLGWITRLRAWWFNATHCRCPVCGHWLNPLREWESHKRTHPRNVWRSAIGLPPLPPNDCAWEKS